MNKYERALWILPAVADASPLAYGIAMPYWRMPALVAFVCSFASIVIGISVLAAIPILRTWRTIPRPSDGALIGAVLAIVGIALPFAFY
jgi:hypothetical protein